MVMLTDKPKLDRVYIKVQEFRSGKYYTSEALTVYDTSASKVIKLIREAVKENGNGK